MPQLPRAILYSFRRCPFAMRARLAIDIAQCPCELREVVLACKPEALLTASPKGTVPVWVDPQAGVIDLIQDIMRHVLSQANRADYVPSSDPNHITHTWVATCDSDFKHHLDRYKYAWRYRTTTTVPDAQSQAESTAMTPDAHSLAELAATTPDAYGLAERTATTSDVHSQAERTAAVMPDAHSLAQTSLANRESAAAFVRQLDDHLRYAPYLAGAQEGWPDLAIAPFIRQFRIADAAWFDVQPWPGVHAWLNGLLESPRFARIMQKFPPWREGEAGVDFPQA